MNSLNKLRAMTADLKAINKLPTGPALKRHAFAPSGRSYLQKRCGLCGKGRNHELHFLQTHEVKPLPPATQAKLDGQVALVFMLTLQLGDRTTVELPFTSSAGIEELDDQAIDRFARQLGNRMKSVRNAVRTAGDKPNSDT